MNNFHLQKIPNPKTDEEKKDALLMAGKYGDINRLQR